MTQPFFFGRAQRTLFGMLHAATGPQRGAMLVCAPLLQDGIRSQRALWLLAEALAAAGVDTLRFDWFGSGDSAGEGSDLQFDGLLDDLQVARSRLRAASPATRTRLFALRSAALPLIAQAAAGTEPVDLVLWDPLLAGRDVVTDWQQQHRQQLFAAGRYPDGGAAAEEDELLGFDVSTALLEPMSTIDAGDARLPAGSRILLAAWEMTAGLGQFVAAQRAAGTTVEILRFDANDRPSWEDPHLFEHLALPRRSVAQLAQRLTSEDAW